MLLRHEIRARGSTDRPGGAGAPSMVLALVVAVAVGSLGGWIGCSSGPPPPSVGGEDDPENGDAGTDAGPSGEDANDDNHDPVVECDDHSDCTIIELCDERHDEEGQLQEAVCVPEDEYVCEVDEDCRDDQLCFRASCVSDQIQDQAYRLTFTVEQMAFGDDSKLMFASSVGVYSHDEIDTAASWCDQADTCVLTEKKDHILVIDGDEASAIPLDRSFPPPPEVDGMDETFAEGIEQPRVRGDGIAYKRQEGGQYVAYYQPFDSDAQQIATLHASGEPPHQWDVDPISGRTFQAIPTPDTLEIRVGSIGQPLGADDEVYTLDSSDSGVGSVYFTPVPAASSTDGRLIAFHTSGPAQYESCSQDTDCTRPGHRCNVSNRCYALEPKVQIIDMDHTGNLGDSCLGHEECGPYHRCDSGEDDFQGGECAPQRISVGVSEGFQGCEATREAGTFEFTDIESSLHFGPDGRVYFVGTRDCYSSPDPSDDVEGDIPRTSIVAADPETGNYEEVFGNVDNQGEINLHDCTGEDRDQVEPGALVEDVDSCTAKIIRDVRFSPEGDDLVYRATSPTASGINDGEEMGVWRVRRDLENVTWIGGQSGGETVVDLRVHPPVVE